MAIRMRGHQLPWEEVARAVGCSVQTALRAVEGSHVREPRPATWVPRVGRLTWADREEIAIGVAMGDSYAAIARRIDKAPSTVSREVAANGGRFEYRGWASYLRAEKQACRPKKTKLASHPVLLAVVTEGLEKFWSPEEISRRLRIDHPDDPMMRVSHETIYQSLYVQARGELRRELTRCLRSGKAKRRPQGRNDTRGKIPDMVMISDRPAEVEDRAIPGNWEGDLLMGANNASAVGTLVERSTRYTILLHLEHGKTAQGVKEAMKRAVRELPAEMVTSITWDQGSEMGRHKEFTVATNIPVYFCDPHIPWQRGTNENTNGLLRQYMPKGTDLSVYTRHDLAEIARSLNDRPRKALDFMKPSEKIVEVFALTD